MSSLRIVVSVCISFFALLATAQQPTLGDVAPILPISRQSFYNADPFLVELPPLNSSFSRSLWVAAWDGSKTTLQAGKPLQELFFSVSNDGGNSWSAPVDLQIFGLPGFEVVWTPVLYWQPTIEKLFVHFTANAETPEGGLYATSCPGSALWNLLSDNRALFACSIPQQIGTLTGTLTRGASPLPSSVNPQSATPEGWHLPFLTSSGLYIIHMQPVLTTPMLRTWIANTSFASSSAVLSMSPNLLRPAVQLTVIDQVAKEITFYATSDLTLEQGWVGPRVAPDGALAVAVDPTATLTIGFVSVGEDEAPNSIPIAAFLMVTSGAGLARSTIAVTALTAEGVPVWAYARNKTLQELQPPEQPIPVFGGLSLGELEFDASLWATDVALGFNASLSLQAVGMPVASPTTTDASIVMTQTFFSLLSVGGDVLIAYNASMRLNGTVAFQPSGAAAGPTADSPATATAITFIIICSVFLILLAVFLVGHIRAKRLRDQVEQGNEGASLLKPGDVSNTTSECHTIHKFE